MPQAQDLIDRAVRDAPRRWRMPPLPATAAEAAAAGAETALAFALEALRRAGAAGTVPDPALEGLFTGSLAAVLVQALSTTDGDPTLQAQLLRTRNADVQAHVDLAAQVTADRRAVLAAVNAIAHPGRLRHEPAGAARDGLARLHELASGHAWSALREAAARWRSTAAVHPASDTIASLLASGALERLERGGALLQLPAVQQYRQWCAQRGPEAGSADAAVQGRASARVGAEAEALAAGALHRMASQLDAAVGGGVRHAAIGGLRTPRGFPGEAMGAKDEWDVALVQWRADGTADILLLAEVKAAAAAAASDYARLVRGLQRLATAGAEADTDMDGDGALDFPARSGPVRVNGRSLQRLQPRGTDLPPHVVYISTAAPAPVAMLSPAARAVLMAEPASLAFAGRLQAGERPSPDALRPLWSALPAARQLRAALQQYDIARRSRGAMVHPDDLRSSLEQTLQAVP